MWLPMMMQPQAMPTGSGVDLLRDRDSRWLLGIRRLKDGIDLAWAEAEIKIPAAQIAAAWPQYNEGRSAIRQSG
ncbi:MAG: hypothetical protein ABI882_02605 [Acidobacteriota bacterium]